MNKMCPHLEVAQAHAGGCRIVLAVSLRISGFSRSVYNVYAYMRLCGPWDGRERGQDNSEALGEITAKLEGARLLFRPHFCAPRRPGAQINAV